MRFLGYMLAKNRYINLKFGIPDVQAWFFNILGGFENFVNFDLWKTYIKNQLLNALGVKNILWKIRDSRFKELFILRM